MEFERSKAKIFEQGLRYEIWFYLSSHLFIDYKDVLEQALKVESKIKRLEQKGRDRKMPKPLGTSNE